MDVPIYAMQNREHKSKSKTQREMEKKCKELQIP